MTDLTQLSPSATAMLAFLGAVIGLFLIVFILDAFLLKGAVRLSWWDLGSNRAAVHAEVMVVSKGDGQRSALGLFRHRRWC